MKKISGERATTQRFNNSIVQPLNSSTIHASLIFLHASLFCYFRKKPYLCVELYIINTVMAQTAGVYIERNTQGVPRFARIDLQKYGEKLMPFFKEIGVDVEVSPYNPEFVKKIKEAEKQPSIKIDLTKYGISI
jgi:hypothetical protein